MDAAQYLTDADLLKVRDAFPTSHAPIIDAIGCGLVVMPFAPMQPVGPSVLDGFVGRPTLLIYGDDPRPGGRSQGPSAFDGCALDFLNRVPDILIYADPEPKAVVYRVVCMSAFCNGAVALIETTPKHQAAWADFAIERAPEASIRLISPVPMLSRKAPTAGRA